MPEKPPKPVPPKDEIRRIATLSLIEVSANQKAPPAARAAAARTLLESLGDIGRLQELAKGSQKPLADMSLTELDDEISRVLKKE
jgi:hypothetical protein